MRRRDATRRPKRDIITTFKKMMVVFRAALIFAAAATRLPTCSAGAQLGLAWLGDHLGQCGRTVLPVVPRVVTALYRSIYLSIFNAARLTLMEGLTFPTHPDAAASSACLA